tara:strand:+ start:23 stop:820 length:798 start_codon:yes stop_codon:yes gene_type:complete
MNEISTIQTPILNNMFTLVELKHNNPDPSANYIERNFSELVYNKINTCINEILTKSRIIKMPTLLHSNIFFIQETTTPVVSDTLLAKNPTFRLTIDIGHQTQQPTPSSTTAPTAIPVATLHSDNLTIPNYTEQMISESKITSPKLAAYLFQKTKDIVNILNSHLLQYKIKIKKASLKFCLKLSSKANISFVLKNSTTIIMENIFLKPIVNLFDHFEFVSTESESTESITDLVQIYKAFTGYDKVNIESYKYPADIIQEFKNKYKI